MTVKYPARGRRSRYDALQIFPKSTIFPSSYYFRFLLSPILFLIFTQIQRVRENSLPVEQELLLVQTLKRAVSFPIRSTNAPMLSAFASDAKSWSIVNFPLNLQQQPLPQESVLVLGAKASIALSLTSWLSSRSLPS